MKAFLNFLTINLDHLSDTFVTQDKDIAVQKENAITSFPLALLTSTCLLVYVTKQTYRCSMSVDNKNTISNRNRYKIIHLTIPLLCYNKEI